MSDDFFDLPHRVKISSNRKTTQVIIDGQDFTQHLSRVDVTVDASDRLARVTLHMPVRREDLTLDVVAVVEPGPVEPAVPAAADERQG